MDLVFRVRMEGIYLYVQGLLVLSFPMRRRISSSSPLLLSFPIYDDNGNRYGMEIKRVSWGGVGDLDAIYPIPDDKRESYRDILAENIDDDPIYRTIKVSNLVYLEDIDSIYELETLFRQLISENYPDCLVEAFNFPRGQSIAYVRLNSNRFIDGVVELFREQKLEGADGQELVLVAERAR